MERQMVVEHLHSLGRSAVTGQHAYLGLDLSGAPYLPDILDEVARFKHLQNIDLSRGYFDSIRPLAQLPCLRMLNLRESNLRTLDDFGAAACPPIGSKSLEELDASNNRFRSMPESLDLNILRELRLAHNKIRRLRGLQGLQFLCVLDLSHNNLGSASTLHLSVISRSLRELYLNDNNIHNLDDAFRQCQRLEILNLARNGISHIEKLDSCVSLRSLDLQGNYLCGIRQMEYLTNLNQLYELDISDNELTAAMDYRSRVLYRLDRLMWLDRMETSSEERVKAANVYGGRELDNRRDNHDEYGLPFTNPLRVWVENRERPQLLHSEVRSDLAGYESLKLRVQMWNEGEDCILPDGSVYKEGVVVHVHTIDDPDDELAETNDFSALHGSYETVANVLGEFGSEFNLLPLRIQGEVPEFRDVINSMMLPTSGDGDGRPKSAKEREREKRRRERQLKAVQKAREKALAKAEKQANELRAKLQLETEEFKKMLDEQMAKFRELQERIKKEREDAEAARKAAEEARRKAEFAAQIAADETIRKLSAPIPEHELKQQRKLVQKLRAAAYTLGGIDLETLFLELDTDGSGELDIQEFVDSLRKARIKKSDVGDAQLLEIFKQVDADGNGTIDVGEFVAWCDRVGGGKTKTARAAARLAGVLAFRRLRSEKEMEKKEKRRLREIEEKEEEERKQKEKERAHHDLQELLLDNQAAAILDHRRRHQELEMELVHKLQRLDDMISRIENSSNSKTEIGSPELKRATKLRNSLVKTLDDHQEQTQALMGALDPNMLERMQYLEQDGALDESVDSTVPPVPMWDPANPATPYKPRTPHTPYTPNNPRTPSTFRPDTGGSWQSYASYQSDLSHSRMSTPGVKTPKPPPISLDRFVGTRAEEVIGVLTAIHIQEMARISSPAGFFEDE